MATFKAEVYAHQKKADGTYNIKIRVTHNQRKKYIATVWYVSKDDLTRSLKIKNPKYITLTDELIKRYRSACDMIGESLKDMDVEQVVEAITADKETSFDLDIVEYARGVIKDMRDTGHTGNAAAYKVALDNLVKFAGREHISVKEITVRFLSDWVKWIKENCDITSGYAPNNYLSKIRAIHNRAKKEFNDEDAGLIRIPNSPFTHIDMPKLPPVRKRALSADMIRRIAELPYETVTHAGNSRFNLAKDVFLLSLCLVGMNGIDLYNCEDCKDGRITYMRTKTMKRRSDNAELSIRIEPVIQSLVDKYRDPTGKRVFKFYKMYGSMATFSTALNRGLKKIGALIDVDDLEFYAARHTWATIAINDVGIDKYTVHSALNHVDETMRVTDIYIKKDWSHIDAANQKVLDYLNLNIGCVKEPLITKS